VADLSILGDSGSAPDGSTLGLLRIPFIFTQDRLLSSGDFIKEAKDRGYELSLETLQELHRHRVLLPFYRLSGHGAAGRSIPVRDYSGMNPRGWVFEAARQGRVHDCYHEGYSVDWPYERLQDQHEPRWQDGFLFSSWQVPDLHHALPEYESIRRGWRTGADERLMRRDRQRSIALAALATRHLPDIVGKITTPTSADWEALWEFRRGCDCVDLLRVAGYSLNDLRPQAEELLRSAHWRDPMRDWWSLLRHSRDDGWSKLKGVPRDCLWERVAAEVLLRTHEELAERGELDPLPDLTSSTFHDALHDRVSPREADAPSLDRALAQFGLSPHPRVLLLLEGQTEIIQVTEILSELGLNRPDRVRVQNCRSSSVNPQLISRYAIAPRLGPWRGKGHILDAPPTALVIAMDPENIWRDQARREQQRLQLQQAIREEVEWQGGVISQPELDVLVNIFVWGDDTYELANFTDDELVAAITQLASEQALAAATSPTWETELRRALQAARREHCDFQRKVGPLRVREDKPRLARILLPTLVAKYQAERAAGTITTPVLQLVEMVRDLILQLSGRGFILTPDGD
jgi:hypothetical protein